MSRLIFWSAGSKRLLLLSVSSNVHRDTKIRYLSNDSFRFSTTFMRKDCRFDVSFSRLDDGLKQTVFLVVVRICFTGTKVFGSYRTRVYNNFRLEKGNFFAPFHNFESKCKNNVTLLIVDSHAHRALRFV